MQVYILLFFSQKKFKSKLVLSYFVFINILSENLIFYFKNVKKNTL